MLLKVVRWLFCVMFVVLALGASLIGDYVTTVSGTMLALFLTFTKKEIEQKTQRPYMLMLVLLLLLFFVSSIWGAINSGP